jgi:hypothetical protein
MRGGCSLGSRSDSSRAQEWSNVRVRGVADDGRCGNCRRRPRRDDGSDWINRWTKYNWNFTGHCDWNIARYNHARLYADPGNDSAWNCESDSWDSKSNARNGKNN